MMKHIGYLADVIMPIGQAVQDAHPGADRFGDRSVLFLPPVDLDEFHPSRSSSLRLELGISADTPVVVVVGNINPQKGHHGFIQGAALVKSQVPNAMFIIAGHVYPNHQAYFESLQQEATRLGLLLGSDVHFLGARRDVANVVAAADVFALASVPNSEGMPTVILEAMATGKPVVATDVGSVKEVVDHGVTGFIVPPLDHVELANCMVSLLHDKAMREEFGKSARRVAEDSFSLEHYLRSHIDAYQLAVEHARIRSRVLKRSR